MDLLPPSWQLWIGWIGGAWQIQPGIGHAVFFARVGCGSGPVSFQSKPHQLLPDRETHSPFRRSTLRLQVWFVYFFSFTHNLSQNNLMGLGEPLRPSPP